MTKIQFLLSATLFAVTLVPALATEQFECPSPFKPNTPAKLEEIKGSLPDVDAMGNIGRVHRRRSILCGGKACQRASS